MLFWTFISENLEQLLIFLVFQVLVRIGENDVIFSKNTLPVSTAILLVNEN